MKHWRVLGWLFISWLVATNSLLAQIPGAVMVNKATAYPRNGAIAGTKINYYKTDFSAFTQVAPPDVFLRQRSANGRLAAPKTQFIVTYTNFTAEAKRAFQYAVDIWASLITSPVPIHIQANWVSMEPNLLGSAGPASYRYNFDGSQKTQAFYPVALAEKIARRSLNDPTEADIVADFNRNNDWYYGTDGKPLKGQMDLVTVVLHELTHGLGFIGFFDFVEDQGVNKEAFPSIYDYFLETEDGRRLVGSKAFPNYSDPLKFQLAGERLYLSGPVLKQVTGQRIKVYAPYMFNLTYSVYHLDDTVYPPGSVNSLMRAHLNRSEAIHSPGPLVLNFFSDLEWKTTSVLHTPSIIDEDVKDFVFSTRIISDTALVPGSPKLVYRKTKPTETDTVATSVALTRVGTTDDYQFTLPAAQAQGEIWYYFQVQDASGRTFSNPGKLTAGSQTWHHLWVGPDKTAPLILFSPSKSAVFSTAEADSLPIYARIADDATGIASAYVDYQLNGVTQPAVPLNYTWKSIGNSVYDSVFVSRINFPANSLKVGDKITYRIVAQDGSKAKNQTVNPTTGYYQLAVVAQQTVREQYINTFNSATAASDFVGYGFGITTPDHFGDPAIHSEHPYRNGTDFQFQANFDYTLLVPIRVRSNPDSAVIRYDEIVLVEPAAPGSKFGDPSFYDYVIIEGSKDNGHTWVPMRDGYNSSEASDWQTLYQSSLTSGSYREQNSTAVGLPAYFRHRDIPILKQGGPFKAGDQLLIRFRLLSDQLAYGWGWAIDNLRIQAPAQLVLANEPVESGQLTVSPNPATNRQLRLEAKLNKSVAEAQLRIISPTGQTFHQAKLKVNGTKINEPIDLSVLAAGLYFLQLTVDDTVLTKKVIVAP